MSVCACTSHPRFRCEDSAPPGALFGPPLRGSRKRSESVSHSFTNLLYHIVFSTKNRHPWLVRTIRPDVFEYIGGLVQQRGGIPLIVNGIEDHVHLFAKLRQDAPIAAIVRDIKAN